MARPPRVLDDATPLNGPAIDVGARIGWLVRTARELHGASRDPDDMARAIGASPRRVREVEAGEVRDGDLVDAYETALGMPAGSMRAPIDIMCRTFPGSPVDRAAPPAPPEGPQHDRLTEQLLDRDSEVAGGAWFTWARSVSWHATPGLPDEPVRTLARRLVAELARSVAQAYPIRYEALSLLRGSAYGGVVLDVAREWVDDPDAQVVYDLMSAIGEAVTAEAVQWCLDVLVDTRPRMVVGASLALENMAQISGDQSFWVPLVDPLTAIFNSSDHGSPGWERLSHLLRLMPRQLLVTASDPLRQPLAPTAKVPTWNRTHLNAYWEDCTRRGEHVATALGLSHHEMVARLLFDIAVSPLESRAVTSYILVSALPDLADLMGAQLGQIIDDHAEPVIRATAARRLPGTLHGAFPEVARRWLDDPDDEMRACALKMAGAAGIPLPETYLQAAATRDDPVPHAALYAAGMTGSPVLAQWVRAGSPALAGGAAWWLRQGSRVTT